MARVIGARLRGRFVNKKTGQQVNIHQGKRGINTVFFYIRSGQRVFLSGYRELDHDWEEVKPY